MAVILALSAAPASCCLVPARAEPVLVVGLDRKLTFDARGQKVYGAPGNDEVLFFHLADPREPRLLGSLILENSVIGPPTNLAVSPDGQRVFIANSLRHELSPGSPGGYRSAPAEEVFVVSLAGGTPRLAATLKVGAQPSGLALDPRGRFLLVANREGRSVSVVDLDHPPEALTVRQTVPLGDVVSAVALTPDARHALVVKFAAHRLGWLDVDPNGRVTVGPGPDIPVGLWPYNVAIAPDGRIALSTNTGNAAISDGHVDPVSVIDLTAATPRVVDFVAVGDAPEGIAISPRGDVALVTLLNGSVDTPPGSWAHHDRGQVVSLRRQNGAAAVTAEERGDRFTVVDRREVGAFPQGVAFTADGAYAYVGNFGSRSLTILRVDPDGRLHEVGQGVPLPGPPASLDVGGSSATPSTVFPEGASTKGFVD